MGDFGQYNKNKSEDLRVCITWVNSNMAKSSRDVYFVKFCALTHATNVAGDIIYCRKGRYKF